MLRSILILLSLLLFSQIANAEIFKWVDSEGNVHFTDKPPENIKIKKVTLKINSYKSVQAIAPEKKKSENNHQTKVLNSSKHGSIDKSVIMYSAAWCGVCKKAKRYFKQKQIAYTELDIDKNEQAKQEYQALNARGVPVIFIDDTRLNGFSVRHFENVYYQ